MRISMKAAGKAAGTFTGIAQYFHSKLLLVISGFLLVQSYSQVVNTAVTAFESKWLLLLVQLCKLVYSVVAAPYLIAGFNAN